MSVMNFLQIYKIGKELGLSHKDISINLLFKNRYQFILGIILLIIFSVFFVLFFNIAIMAYANRPDSIYPSGTLYSSVRLKDFKRKKIKLK